MVALLTMVRHSIDVCSHSFSNEAMLDFCQGLACPQVAQLVLVNHLNELVPGCPWHHNSRYLSRNSKPARLISSCCPIRSSVFTVAPPSSASPGATIARSTSEQPVKTHRKGRCPRMSLLSCACVPRSRCRLSNPSVPTPLLPLLPS